MISYNACALQFNTNKIIELSSKGTKLAEDEGYLLLSLDNIDKIGNLMIKPVNSGNKMKFTNVIAGENFALIKLKACEYYWDLFMYFSGSIPLRYEYKKDKYRFTVESGVINYPGTWSSATMHTNFLSVYHRFNSQNKTAYELDKLKRNYHNIYNNHPFKFQGQVKENYPDFLKKISKEHQVDKTSIDNYVSYDIKDGIQHELSSYPNVEKYLKNYNQSIGHFNPQGQYLLFSMVVNKISLIRVLNLSSYDVVTIFQQELPPNSYVNNINWVDNDTIYYSIYYKGKINHRIAHLKIDPGKQVVGAKQLQIQLNGSLVDSLPEQEDVLYFAKKSKVSKRQNGLYKINVSSQKAINKTIRKPYQVVKKLKDSIYTLTASDGEIRFIITANVNKKNNITLFDYWFLPHDGKWQKIYSTTSEQESELPHFISRDLKHFYVLTNKYSDKKSIHLYSTEKFAHQGVFYEDDTKEIERLVLDQFHEIIGIVYYEDGFAKVKYFENDNDALKSLRSQFPEHKFYIAQRNNTANKILVYATNQYSKGSWSIYDTQTKTIDKLFELNPVYSSLEKGIFHAVNMTASDGVNLEGYLVLPQKINNHRTPLVVMPHGGPIGVRDSAYNTDLQHFYATQGFATLKVNYRGSSGFGKQFQQSGQQQWGEKIESDINEMTDHVIKKFKLSDNKICAMGGSYGGYSALMLTILYPDRYQCAVSVMGVTDIPLMFTSADFRNHKKYLDGFKEIVGDPEKNHQKLIDKSPLYLTNKMTKPVLLLHGIYDKRVAPEHSLRMKQALDISGKQSELIMLKNEGHSFKNIESRVIYATRALDFIKKSVNIQTQ